MRQNIFMAVALLIGLGLIVLSFYLTPLVENSTDRAKQAVRGVQILGVAIFCISATKLTCQGSHSNFNILLGIMFLLGGVCTGLFSIIHNDCVDARTFTPYALGVSVCIMIGSFIGIFVHNRKTKIKESVKSRSGVPREILDQNIRVQNNEMLNKQSDDDESNDSSETTTPESEDFYEAPQETKDEILRKLLDHDLINLSDHDRLQNFEKFIRNLNIGAKSSKMPPTKPSSFKDSPKATLSINDHPLKSTS